MRRPTRAQIAPNDPRRRVDAEADAVLASGEADTTLVSGRLPDGTGYALPTYVAEWNATAIVDNGVAVANRAAPPAGGRHYVTGISGSFNAALIRLMRLLIGGVVAQNFHVHNQRDVEFDTPIECPVDAAVSVDLAASGTAGQVGTVNLRGFTIVP